LRKNMLHQAALRCSLVTAECCQLGERSHFHMASVWQFSGPFAVASESGMRAV
jgi:hypothetical protein